MVWLIAIAGGVGVLLLVWRSRMPTLEGALSRAVEQRTVTEVVSLIDARAQSAQPTAFNRAIKRLWDAYERELAVELVRELARRHKPAKIAQYWLKQVLSAEPSLAKQYLGKGFLEAHYDSEVAAQCGKVG